MSPTTTKTITTERQIKLKINDLGIPIPGINLEYKKEVVKKN